MLQALLPSCPSISQSAIVSLPGPLSMQHDCTQTALVESSLPVMAYVDVPL